MMNNFFRKNADLLIGVLAGLLSLFWAAIIAVMLLQIDKSNLKTAIDIAMLAVTSIAAASALWKFFEGKKFERSKVYLEEAINLIEKSYETLRVENDNFPVNDATVWLSSSRLLEGGLSLGKKITDQSHKDTFEELIHYYWRVKFMEKVLPNGRGPKDEYYYYESGSILSYTSRNRAPLSQSSIAAIYRFIEWPDEQEDHLDAQNRFTDTERRGFRYKSPGLYKYLKAIDAELNSLHR